MIEHIAGVPFSIEELTENNELVWRQISQPGFYAKPLAECRYWYFYGRTLEVLRSHIEAKLSDG